MTVGIGARKVALIAHVAASVGWFGTIAAFLALAVAGLVSQDALVVRASYVGMDLIAWYVILPLCLAALLTGLIQGWVSPWGLFSHYWVVVKLLLTVLATVVLLIHLQPISYVAGVAVQSGIGGEELMRVRIQLLVDAAAAMGVLLVNTALSVLKPKGLTRHGRRMHARGER